MNKAMRVISASFVAVLLCLTVVSLPAPVRGESLRRPTPDSLARPQALVHNQRNLPIPPQDFRCLMGAL